MDKSNSIFKNRLLFSVALILSIMIVFSLSASAFAADVPVSVKTTKAQLNIRSQADTYSSILTVIEKEGTLLYPVEQVDANWLKVRFANNVYGYVYVVYVKDAGPVQGEISLFPGSAIRTAANESASIQKTCSVGTELTVYSQSSDWYKVKSFGGESGFIKKSSVKLKNIVYPEINKSSVITEDLNLLKVTSSTNAKIRSGAGTSNSEIAEVSKNTIIQKSGEVKGTDGFVWYKVPLKGGKTGYIRSDVVAAYSDKNALKGKTIVIDPGHGAYKSQSYTTIDEGNIGVSGTLEKDVNLNVSKYLQSYLSKAGATVIMTRDGDKYSILDLKGRAEIANKNKADIFISVHCNYSTKDASKRGAVTYYYTDNTVSSSIAAARKKLANNLQKSLVFQIGANDAGSAVLSFTVLKQSKMASAMVELGYLSNSAEEKLLINKDYQKYCAQGLYEGILTYYNN